MRFPRLIRDAAFLILAHYGAVAADGTSAPAPLGLQHSLSLQRPTSKRQQIPPVAVSFAVFNAMPVLQARKFTMMLKKH